MTDNSLSLFDKFMRGSVGFDPLLRSIVNAASEIQQQCQEYPPYNIIHVSDDQYKIEVALAGFKKNEILVSCENHMLTVCKAKEPLQQPSEIGEKTRVHNLFLHNGVAKRNFSLKFRLESDVEVSEVKLEDGILSIGLVKIQKESSKKYLEIK